MNKARQIGSFDELFNQNGNELFLLSLNGDTHTMSLNTIKDFCVSESVTGGTYNQSTGVLTLSDNSGGSFTISGFKNDDITLTGGTYDNGTITFSSNNGTSFSVDGLYTGYTAPTDIYITGGTYSAGTTTFTNSTGGTFNVTGFNSDDVIITGGTYDNGTTTFKDNAGGSFDVTGFTIDRPSLSDLGFNITPLPTAVIRQDINLPEDSYVTYSAPLVISSGYTLTVPPSSIFVII
jgi:hypothetical protein